MSESIAYLNIDGREIGLVLSGPGAPNLVIDPKVPRNELWFRDPNSGQIVGKIVGLAVPAVAARR